MACSNCGSGGCGTEKAGCKNNGNCGTTGCNKLEVFDWLVGMESVKSQSQFVEVRFKNTRKEIFRNSEKLSLHIGDTVTVEAMTGHDVGMVSLTGELVKFQMKKSKVKDGFRDLKRVLRKSTEPDIEAWQSAQAKEHDTMIRARKLVRETGLNMKVSDVEYQADNSKATFYYIAEERVDFRQLIKQLADTFRVRVDMRQIGSRQEAGRIGGIGSCGRELCCSTWLTDFRSVSTSAARYQQLSINPMKLAGQCGKLKCCLNYELDSYMDAIRHFPSNRVKLKTKRGLAIHQKSDIFRGMMWYAYEDALGEFIPLEIDRVKEVIALNEKGKTVDDLSGFKFQEVLVDIEPTFEDVIGEGDLTRFDKKKGKRPNKRKGNKKSGGAKQNQQEKQKASSQKSGNSNPKNRNKKRNQRNRKGGKNETRSEKA